MELSPLEALRALMARVSRTGSDLTAANFDMAAPAVFTTAILLERRAAPIRPDPTHTRIVRTYSMMNAGMPDEVEVAGLDTYLMAVCDHGLNTSTFAPPASWHRRVLA